MLDCLVLGDSIAVGLHQQIPQCRSLSKSGWNTWQWNRDYLKNDLAADTVIISLGSNDHRYIKTQAELERLRDKITASRVYWVLPKGNSSRGGLTVDEVQRIINTIAALHGDTVIPITRVQSDGIHPSWAGYKQIASSIKQ